MRDRCSSNCLVAEDFLVKVKTLATALLKPLAAVALAELIA
jgi:hypothetical protein